MDFTQFTQRTEAFLNEISREQYQVGAGLKESLELTPIYHRHADLFTRETVLDRLEDADRKEGRHLASFAAVGFMDNGTKELSEAVTNAELKATVEWDGQNVPYHNVRPILTKEPDWRRRHDLGRRSLAVMAKQNPLRAQRLSTLHALPRDLGFPGYVAMNEKLEAWDLKGLAEKLDAVVAATSDVFERELSRRLVAAGVPRAEADIWDVAYIMRASELDKMFPADRLIGSLEKTLNGMGIGLETTPGLHLDTEPRPLKSPRAFCAAIRVPTEVMLVIKPIGGQDDYGSLFHEAGHAEHFSHADPALPVAFRYMGDAAVSETYAFLMEHLLYNRRWLADVLQSPPELAEEYRRFSIFSKLWFVRRYAAKLRYELHLHAHGPDGSAPVYQRLLHNNLKVSIPQERYLDDVDDWFYVGGYTRAWIFEMQLREHLVRNWGETWYTAREAGAFLKSLWAAGIRDSVDEMARSLGYAGLDPRPLTEELVSL
ncbi:MAG: hypothetical protein IT330_08420 [Anaerolineae bacterium]|nr:hypothetical protein [Anaerolineae bacterium]